MSGFVGLHLVNHCVVEVENINALRTLAFEVDRISAIDTCQLFRSTPCCPESARAELSIEESFRSWQSTDPLFQLAKLLQCPLSDAAFFSGHLYFPRIDLSLFFSSRPIGSPTAPLQTVADISSGHNSCAGELSADPIHAVTSGQTRPHTLLRGMGSTNHKRRKVCRPFFRTSVSAFAC